MCYNDKSAGSPGLKKAVERMNSAPHLWLFGHIHEARGGSHVRFRKDKPPVKCGGDGPGATASGTLCINAANANDGPAKSVVRPATVVDIAYFDKAMPMAEEGRGAE